MEKTLDVSLQTRTATAVSSNTRLICAMSPKFNIFKGSTSSSPLTGFPGCPGLVPAMARVPRCEAMSISTRLEAVLGTRFRQKITKSAPTKTTSFSLARDGVRSRAWGARSLGHARVLGRLVRLEAALAESRGYLTG